MRLKSFLGPVLTLGLGSACVADPGQLAASEEAIVGGTIDRGHPEVVFLMRFDGAACTGALVSPHVVLTARHCVVDMRSDTPASPSLFRVMVGTSSSDFGPRNGGGPPGYSVSRVAILPGSSSGDLNIGRSTDVGLLVLTTAATETPREMALDRSPSTLVGGRSTAVGFGETPSGGSGVKYTAPAPVTGLMGGFIAVDPTVCSGDSGGPLIGPDGRIYGVASFIFSPDGNPPRCGTAPGMYNAIQQHAEWIEGVIESTGDICSPDAEICDGLDNDCNGSIDETCVPLGTPCTDSSQCQGSLCADTPAGRICTAACDPTQPRMGCQAGSFCAGVPNSCNGFCVPGTLGATALESPCASDVECASGVCRDPGDGRRRCLDPCRGDAGLCMEGQVCFAGAGACGVCVPAALSGSPRGNGEVCTRGDQCRSGTCTPRGDLGECTVPCGSGCAANFQCLEGRCVVRRNLGVGAECQASLDCTAGGVCARSGSDAWCTRSCASTACPTGFSCATGDVRVCIANEGLDGDVCDVAADCASGVCLPHPSNSSVRVCSAACSRDMHCGVGQTCEIAGPGMRGCFGTLEVAPPPTPPPSGCGCSLPSSRSSAGGLVGALGLAIVVVRRRRRAG